MFHNPRKAALFISVLGLLSITTTGLYSVHARACGIREPCKCGARKHRRAHKHCRDAQQKCTLQSIMFHLFFLLKVHESTARTVY